MHVSWYLLRNEWVSDHLRRSEKNAKIIEMKLS